VNRALLIILVPTVLVILGYLVVLDEMGIAPAYGRLAGSLGAFACAIWWLGRRSKKKAQWAGK
jgi:uncharacterized membrane protein